MRLKYVVDEKSDIFVKAYRTFLRAEGEMSIDQIVGLYRQMEPGLHKGVSSDSIDCAALIYAFLRLPAVIGRVKKIVLAQTDEIFHRSGFAGEGWEEVDAPARRRKMLFNTVDTLAMFINSVTDVDDIVGLLTAFQIEWNKMHSRLSVQSLDMKNLQEVQSVLGISDENWKKLMTVWSEHFGEILAQVKSYGLNFRLTLLRGSYVDYKRAAQKWMENIIEMTNYKDFRNRPIYFVSSNNHSLVNTITGWVNLFEKQLIEYLEERQMHRFLDYWDKIQTGEQPGSKENFLWYILKKYEREYPEAREKRIDFEKKLGIEYIEAQHYLDVNAQVIALSGLIASHLPQKLRRDLGGLSQSNALIVNIDYPLGYGAYMLLNTFLQNTSDVRGVYILGKASFLNGNLGDIGLPTSVFDTNSKNTFVFNNAFTREYFSEFVSGSVLTDQRALTTGGTLIHAERIIQEYFLQNFTIVEMENGPYLNAIYETAKYDRYPENEMINLVASPIDIGIIHYASDTPFTNTITLGTRNLGYEGVEATYVSSLVILKRIIEMESRLS